MRKIRFEFHAVLDDFNNSSPMRRLLAGEVTMEHYKGMLRQIFHHVREDPQIQALATVYFRGHQRAVIKQFFKHATSEIGHDQLALNDLKALGEDVCRVQNSLPATSALLGFAFYQIYHLDPVGYLGYLFFLEFTPTQHGSAYIDRLSCMGVPKEAMSFLIDRTKIDVSRNLLMDFYVQEMVANQEALNSVVYAMKVTGRLYADMIQEAFDQVDNPKDWGISSVERFGL